MAKRRTPSSLWRHPAASYPLALAALLAGCAGAPKAVPEGAASAPGSAPGPVYGGQTAPGTARSWSPQMETAERQIHAAVSGTDATVTRTTDQRLWVTVPGDLAFQPSRSALKPAATALLDKIVLALRNVPGAEVRIVGHTDTSGSAAGNDALSLDRAASTRDWLVARGLSPVRLSVAGRGSRDPVAGNDSESGRASNRRVELLIGEPARPAPTAPAAR